MGENTVLGISETANKKKHDLKLWDSEPKTHVMFRFDRQSSIKIKGDGVLLLILIKLAPKLRDLNLFNKKNVIQYGLNANRTLTLRVNKKNVD